MLPQRTICHRLSIYLSLTGLAGLTWLAGCSVGQVADPPPMTASRCKAQPGFVFVAAGPFTAGSTPEERDYGYQIAAAAIGDTPSAIAQAKKQLQARGWFAGERTPTEIDLPAFCISANLVTQANYAQFVAATQHRAPGISEAEYQTQGFLVHPYEAVQPYRWQTHQAPSDRQQHPVVLVSHADALAYAAWRGQQDGVTYRLPTELEWQKAARGTDGRYFPWGNQWQDDATNWGGSGLDGTSAIATFPLSRSPHGVEDMAGNVFEFTSTLVNDDTQAVMVGCSWDDLPGFCRAAYRHTRPVASRHILFGFRLVVE
jgi:formylglycine-generating enzyme required for sulfatase activity